MGRKIAVVGGGASGLTAAIVAARAGADVHLFERNEKLGRKILASGNGRCNISNTHLRPGDYQGRDPSFTAYSLSTFGFGAFEAFCRSIGLLLDVKEDGRVYPRSGEARAVTLCLECAARSAGVRIHLATPVEGMNRSKEGFRLQAGGREHGPFSRALIAAGSEAAPQLGGGRDGLAMAEAFGHTAATTHPSLVQLQLDSPYHARMNGVKQCVDLTLYRNRKKTMTLSGDVLFTKYGISGFAVLDISQYAVSALTEGDETQLGLNLLPEYDARALAELLGGMAATMAEEQVSTLLSALVPAKMAAPLAMCAELPKEMRAGELGAKTCKRLAHLLGDWRFRVCGDHGFRHAEVAGGGILTSGVDPMSMESRHAPGLYMSGEVLDVVGRRGGYNLHFAWASGWLAGRAMIKAE